MLTRFQLRKHLSRLTSRIKMQAVDNIPFGGHRLKFSLTGEIESFRTVLKESLSVYSLSLR